VIQENWTDIIGYVFQIYGALILYRPDDWISEDYLVILNSILDTDNWNTDLKYLAPGQSKIICAVAYKYPDVIQKNL